MNMFQSVRVQFIRSRVNCRRTSIRAVAVD
jgi:hypothetical protein